VRICVSITSHVSRSVLCCNSHVLQQAESKNSLTVSWQRLASTCVHEQGWFIVSTSESCTRTVSSVTVALP